MLKGMSVSDSVEIHQLFRERRRPWGRLLRAGAPALRVKSGDCWEHLMTASYML